MAIVQINIGDHTSSQAGYIAIPNHYRARMRWARSKAFWIVENKPAADVYFSALPGGKSLRTLLRDNSIWVNYHATMPFFGETNAVGGKEIAISSMAFRMGRWTVLATMIHELAHVDGAPGGTDQSAERALVACGLGKQSELTTGVDDPHTPYDPDIEG